jgi:hypothetical protein
MLPSNILIKVHMRIAIAAVVSGLIVVLTAGLFVVLTADAPGADVAELERAQHDRLPVIMKGAACSQRGWPHYERSCLFDKRESVDEARKVRVIDLEPH